MPELLQRDPSAHAPQPPLGSRIATDPDDHLARLLAPDTEEPWYKSMYRNIQELIHPPELPPLELTSKPVAVKDIWGLYQRDNKSLWMSLGFQSAVVILLLTVFSQHAAIQKAMKDTVHILDPNLTSRSSRPRRKPIRAAAEAA